jgi:hypothetical protein
LVISPCPDRGANTKKKKKNIYLFFNFIGKEDSRSPKAPNLRCTIIPPPLPDSARHKHFEAPSERD